jgi:NADH-quinone oxidoreductase subunit A
MDEFLIEYLPILIFLGIAGGLATVILLASFLIARQRPDAEKVSAYECGFEPFEDARGRFDVRFYLVAILFIIFDLEVAVPVGGLAGQYWPARLLVHDDLSRGFDHWLRL